MNKNSRSEYLPARWIQLIGIVLLVGSAVFWGFTGKESVLLTSSAMSLILLGSYKSVVDQVRKTLNGKDNQNGDV